MAVSLQWFTTIDDGPEFEIDRKFTAYDPGRHFKDDMFRNKTAFHIGLNFPEIPLEEKNALGNDRLAWAYARLGDVFAHRDPEGVGETASDAYARGEIYISNYNIYMGALVDDKGRKLFPDDMVLLSHWNLRDEIKSNYGRPDGVEKQRMVHQVMNRIISQEIPLQVINSDTFEWNPYSNDTFLDGKSVSLEPEGTERYRRVLDNFHELRRYDKPGENAIDRHFNREMEISEAEVVSLLTGYLATPELREVGEIIARRTGRPLEAFDIWYDGFKARSSLDEDMLSDITRSRYPDAQAFEDDLPNILITLGFRPERSEYLAARIAVDDARGSGHALGAARKGSRSRLRTRIPDSGLDYKGYNIAIHEFGHNVEQTISLYDVDYYMLSGVPNTAFTEALAFVFQKRDLDILGMGGGGDGEARAPDVLDKAWSLYEICGVSLVDIRMWQWLYANPGATAEELKNEVINIAKEVWNDYYAPVFGTRDQTILAVYSHMINYPLYLSAYAFGQLIEFQLENHLEGKDFATEVERIFRQGRLTPGTWMLGSTGEPLSVEPLTATLREVLAAYRD
ncbi:MAG: hypothetical protein LUD76_04150 [Alistipes sp.]|nr:hypothetical protein [Alistipes sp.]